MGWQGGQGPWVKSKNSEPEIFVDDHKLVAGWAIIHISILIFQIKFLPAIPLAATPEV
jgi:hypothetical protein